jgi:magnesium chelatase family protein
MLVTVSSASLRGITGHPVQVEVHIAAGGLPGFTIIGSPDATCREARDRVRAAVLNSGFTWPPGRITVNLAPGDLPKTGAALDLPIALGVLAADDQLSADLLAGTAFLGELGLDGAIRPVRGVLSLLDAFDPATAVVVPPDNLTEAHLTSHPYLRTAPDLAALVAALRHDTPWPTPDSDRPTPDHGAPGPDLADIRAEPLTVLALEVAAAGGHHLLFVGPHGAGATLLARVAAALAPPLDPAELVETARIRSAAGLPVIPGHGRRPFREPHHSASLPAVIGGAGPTIAPGELSLAHAGTLFLEDLPEHPATTLDAIAHTLDRGTIRVARGTTTVDLPARFQLIAAMAPCPGHHPDQSCTCSDAALARYRRRVPTQLLDRLALRIALPPASHLHPAAHHDTASASRRVAGARTYLQSGITPTLTDDAACLLDDHHRAGTLSARGRLQVIDLAHTITALNKTGYWPHVIDAETITLALQLRPEPHQLIPRPQ